jgi:hypothetical protein
MLIANQVIFAIMLIITHATHHPAWMRCAPPLDFLQLPETAKTLLWFVPPPATTQFFQQTLALYHMLKQLVKSEIPKSKERGVPTAISVPCQVHATTLVAIVLVSALHPWLPILSL